MSQFDKTMWMIALNVEVIERLTQNPLFKKVFDTPSQHHHRLFFCRLLLSAQDMTNVWLQLVDLANSSEASEMLAEVTANAVHALEMEHKAAQERGRRPAADSSTSDGSDWDSPSDSDELDSLTDSDELDSSSEDGDSSVESEDGTTEGAGILGDKTDGNGMREQITNLRGAQATLEVRRRMAQTHDTGGGEDNGGEGNGGGQKRVEASANVAGSPPEVQRPSKIKYN